MFMSVTLARCPASSDIMMVVTSVLLGGGLLPALLVTIVLCPPPATVLLRLSLSFFVRIHSTDELSCTLSS